MSLFWHDDPEEATRVATSERKPLMLDFALPG